MGGRVRVILVGVGLAGQAFLEALSLGEKLEGLWHPEVGGRRVEDLELAAVYDVDEGKVGRALGELSETLKVFPLRVEVGLHLDEPIPGLKLAGNLKSVEELAEEWKNLKADVAVNLITSGGFKSSRAYAEAALKAGCCFLNATPTRIATDKGLEEAFRRAGLTLAGDDLLSQLGGTVLHRSLLSFLARRGLRVVKSYELDVGGGLDTLSTLRREVKESKRRLIEESLRSELQYAFPTMAGTTDYVEFLGRRRVSYIYLEGEGPLKSQLRLDVTLRSVVTVKAVTILLEVVRGLKAARENGEYCAPL
ncbi:MAG: hypothetical protein DRO46_02840, partial [Candidatus Hecatellales archaeon]